MLSRTQKNNIKKLKRYIEKQYVEQTGHAMMDDTYSQLIAHVAFFLFKNGSNIRQAEIKTIKQLGWENGE